MIARRKEKLKMKNKFLQRITSRKFIISALGTIGGLATSLIGVGGKVGSIAGIISATAITINYVYTEGKIDKASVGLIVDGINDALKKDGDK